MHRFAGLLIAFRTSRMLPLDFFDLTLNESIARHRIEWHGVALGEPDWSDTSHSLAATFHFDAGRVAVHLMINAYWEALAFAVPPQDERFFPWRRCVDTFRPSPDDVRVWGEAETVRGGALVVQPRSIVVLVTYCTDAGTQSTGR